MQLFSIGLFMLNPDGSQQLDGNGFPIPTYDNNDIKEMAKIFTGLHGGAVMPCPPDCPPWWPMQPQFGLDPYFDKNSAYVDGQQPARAWAKDHAGW